MSKVILVLLIQTIIILVTRLILICSTVTNKPDQGYENNLVSIGINTEFEQYKNIFIRPGIEISYDDLRTDGTASSLLKKQKERSMNYYSIMVSHEIKEIDLSAYSGYINFGQEFPIYADPLICFEIL